uniref:PFQ25.7c n=1 Tax=Streptomyces sp. F2 TaxID=317660 RepID=Q58IT4_9ACTN|nr:pFQ25.7c [Streptomyces sp. F2]
MSSATAVSPAARLRGLKPDWLNNPKVWRTEVLAGLVVALALIPEAISFSIIAGVDPAVGLFASFTMAVVISIVGGRRAMISAATGAIALVIAPLNREHGLGYLIAAVILAGVFQIALGALGVAKLMRFIPRSVMVGFVNALAILIFMAQVPELRDVPWAVYPLIIGGLALMVFFPKVTTVIPAPLVSIVILTVITVGAAIAVPTVGDKGALPSSLPVPGLPDVPFTMDTLTTIAPYAFAMALVGLMESLMTAKLVDDITDTHSNKTRESIGQGVANIVTGCFGGMGGCAMIGQTMINVKVSGARTRVSTFLAGAFLMVLCIVFGPIVSDIPMAALVAVMIMVSFATFDWHSIAPKTLKRMPAGEIGVMVITVVAVVTTHNSLIGVVVGSITAMVVFPSGSLTSPKSPPWSTPTAARSSTGHRELFFASSKHSSASSLRERPEQSRDRPIHSARLGRLLRRGPGRDRDEVPQRGKSVEITGLNDPSAQLHGKLSGELAASH